MKRILLISSFLVGAILCIDAIVLLTFTQSMGNILVLCLGIVFMLVGVYYNRFGKWLKKLTKITMAVCIPVCAVMISFIAIKGNVNSTTFNEGYVIVLGSGLKGNRILLPLQKRLNKCLEYISHNPNAIIIVSGGQGEEEAISEALAMERYLVANGVSKEKIIREDKSTDTYENFKFSKRLIDSLSKGSDTEPSIVCITNDFHAYRASRIAVRQGFEVNSYSAKLPLYLRPPTYLREVLSMFKFWVYQ